MAADEPKQIIVIIDGVRFEIDYTAADVSLLEDISRIVKGLFKILEKRAQHRAIA